MLLLCLASSSTNVTLYLFYSTTCPHCHAEVDFLQKIGPQYPSLEIRKFAVDISDENLTLMNRFAKAYSLPADYSVPQTYIGNTVVVGFSSENTHGKIIEDVIQNCSKTECADPLAIVLESEKGQAVNTTVIEKDLVEFPIIGIVDIGAIPLPYLVVIAAVLLVIVKTIVKRILKFVRSS
jgi:glutaredoxin